MLAHICSWFLDVIFPKYCLACHQEGSYLCKTCSASIPVYSSVSCLKCGKRSPNGRLCHDCRKKANTNLNGLFVASDWNNILLRQIIYCYKYNFVKELSDPLSLLMITFLETIDFENVKTNKSAFKQLVLIPVPLHKRRLNWRGFNQAKLLCKNIGDYFKLDIENVLMRTHNTLPQAEIDRQIDRHKNIQNAFEITDNFKKSTEDFKDKILVLVDDVCTTTATLEECARILKRLKPKEILGLVIARG
jgi:competence protein ComFC